MPASPVTSDEAATHAIVAHTRAAQRRNAVMRMVLGLGFPLVLFVLWEVLARGGVIDQRFFPPPSRIVTTTIETLGNANDRGQLSSDIVATLARLSVGYVLGALIGILTGVLMGLYAPIRFALGPMVYATFPTPKIAIFPLLIVMFGIGNASKMALVTLGVFFMTCMSTLSGVLYANPIYQDVARAFRLPTWTRWTRVIIPSALPAIVTGLKHAETELVCSIDADCTYDPRQLPALLRTLTQDMAMVTASPYHPQGKVENVPAWRLWR